MSKPTKLKSRGKIILWVLQNLMSAQVFATGVSLMFTAREYNSGLSYEESMALITHSHMLALILSFIIFMRIMPVDGLVVARTMLMICTFCVLCFAFYSSTGCMWYTKPTSPVFLILYSMYMRICAGRYHVT